MELLLYVRVVALLGYMLFIFPQPGKYPFWMKEMNFPLDFIFIKDKIIVDLKENVSPPVGDEAPQVINAKTEFDHVLEVNAGSINAFNLKIGDSVSP